MLDNNNIQYVLNKPIKRLDGHCYFLDFYIEVNDYMLDLEIDGKQHTYDDRVESDKRRDEYLTSVGYVVYRVP